jgi:hypothetical protein
VKAIPSGKPKLVPDEGAEAIEGMARPDEAQGASMKPRAHILWVVSLFAASLGGVAAAFLATTVGDAGHGRADTNSTAVPRAADLRRRADEACDARRWKQCERFLDQARDLDPAGEQAPAVQARRRALQAFAQPEAAGDAGP